VKKKPKAKRKPLVRRTRRSLAERLRSFWVLGALLAFGAAYGLWIGANLKYFHVKKIEIAGIAHVTRADVAQSAHIPIGTSIWFLDTGGIARRIDALPYVLTAKVHRVLPSTVRIEVVERVPDGCVRSDDGAELTIDAMRRVLKRGCAPKGVVYLPRDADDTPPGTYVSSADLTKLQRDARTLLTGTNVQLTDFTYDRFGQLEARLDDGVRVKFGDDDDLDRKRALIGPILASLGSRARDVSSIDLRTPATPVVERK
jgi:cell division protein FtsQ